MHNVAGVWQRPNPSDTAHCLFGAQILSAAPRRTNPWPRSPSGDLPEVGSDTPGFTLVATDLSEKSLSDYAGKTLVLNIFPSVDTPVCAAGVRAFNEKAADVDAVVLCISADLPFAQSRFCGAEGIEGVESLSTFRNADFGDAYGMRIVL